MRFIVLLIGILILSSCTNPHEGIYIYRKQAYTTENISEFEVSHFKKEGTRQVIILDNYTGENAKQKLKEAETLCQDMAMTCQTIQLTTLEKADKDLVIKTLEPMSQNRFMIMSENSKETAFLVGVFSKHFHKVGPDEVENILSGLGIPKDSDLKEKILK